MKSKRTDFEKQWQRRRRALQASLHDAPSDDAVLAMSMNAQQEIPLEEGTLVSRRPRLRWIPFAAAASVFVGVSIIGIAQWKKKPQLPVAEVVTVDGQAVRFLCNSGCSADDVIQSARNIMIK